MMRLLYHNTNSIDELDQTVAHLLKAADNLTIIRKNNINMQKKDDHPKKYF